MNNPDDSWAEVELWRWQYGELPASDDMRPLDHFAPVAAQGDSKPKKDLEEKEAAPESVKATRQIASCPDCNRTTPHIHCTECGSTEHVASSCDMMG